MKFEEKLQSLRKVSSLSQEQLADKLGVSRQAVSKWESGTSYPEMDKLIAMCKIFKCSMDDLVNDDTSDKTIMKNKNVKNSYIDSLLEFITKSVNMFCSMKFTSLIKCFIELFLIGAFLGIFAFLGNEIIHDVIDYVFYFNGSIIGEVITSLLSTLVFVALIAIVTIIFIQVYKVRYLDYYDLLIYKYEQEKELSDEVELKDKLENKKVKKEKIKLADKREHIIIRDPSHRPFEFLSVISKFIMGIIKFFVLCFSLCFVVSLIILIIGLVLSIYLIFKNFIFFGITLGIIGLITINIVILWLVYDFITNKKVPVRNIFIIILISILISSVGAGISLIKLKDFKFVESIDNSYAKTIQKEYKFNENLYIDFANHNSSVYYKIDNSINNVRVKIEYSEILNNASLIENDNSISLSYEYIDFKFNDLISMILEDLKNDTIRNMDNLDELNIMIIANEKNLKQLLKNVSKNYHIDVYNVKDGFKVYFEEIYADKTLCELDDDGYYNCIGVTLSDNINEKEFKIEYNNHKLIYDSKKYYCYYNGYDSSYSCQLHEEVYNNEIAE